MGLGLCETGKGEGMAAQSSDFGTGKGDPTEIDPVKIAGEGRDGSEYIDPEGRNSVANTVNISGEGRDWTFGFEKQLASSTAGSVDPTVREQGAGDHDSWVSRFSQQIATDPFAVSGSGADGSYVANPVEKPPIQPLNHLWKDTLRNILR